MNEPIPVTKPASQIEVRHFRQILIWPFLIKSRPSADQSERAGQFSLCNDRLSAFPNRTSPVWKRQLALPVVPPPADPYGGPWTDNDPTFEEIVYFHPFVRDFLYGDGGSVEKADSGSLTSTTTPGIGQTRRVEKNRPFVRYSRHDVQTVEFKVCPPREPEIDRVFAVPRVELYLCKPLIGILALEIVWQAGQKSSPIGEGSASTLRDRPMSLAEAQAIQAMFRQAYPPYFDTGKSPALGGNCPTSVCWKDENGQVIAESDFDSGRAKLAAAAHKSAEPPLAAHWRKLLEPFVPLESVEELNASSQQVFVQQIVDDRIPGMTYLAVDDPRAISEGDFTRLAFCDPPGKAPAPYASAFLKDVPGYYYDRFWCRTNAEDSPDPASPYTLDTRFLCSGNQFVAIGSAHNPFFANLIPGHFRRIYFRMALIAHYERAALLKFADDLSDALRLIAGKRPQNELRNPEFRDRIRDLQMTFLKFRSRSWFAEVSSQLQGQELFDLWRRQLRTQDLFDQVEGACGSLHSALIEHESRGLSLAAFVALPIGLALTAAQVVLAMINDDTKWNPWASGLGIGMTVLGLVVTCGVLMRAGYLPRRINSLTSPDS